MKVYLIFLSTCIVVYLSSCNSSHYNEYNRYNDLSIDHLKRNPDPTLAIEEKFIKDMQNQGFKNFLRSKNIHFNSVRELCYWFDTDAYGFDSINDARLFAIKVSEDLLRRFNDNPKIRPFLSKYPFKPIDLALIFSFVRRESPSLSEINVVVVCDGEVSYRWSNCKPHRPDYKESYEEAKRLYEAEQRKAKESQESNSQLSIQLDSSSLAIANPRKSS